MMKSRLITLIAILVLAGTQLLVAQGSLKRDVSAFTEISLRISAKVHIKQGSTQSVEVKGKEATLEKLITEVSDRKLVIRYPNDSWFSKWSPGTVDVYVTMPQIDGLTVSGSGSIISDGEIVSRILDVNLSGSGDVKLTELKVEKLSATVSGSGNIHLTGKQNAAEFKAVISGSGNIKAAGFPAENVDVKIVGAGNSWVNAVKVLYVRIAGSGNVTYKGNPSVDSSIAGSGRVKEEK